MKFYDAIGYAVSAERPEGSGKWEDTIVERKLYGDIIRPARSLSEGDKVNNDFSISNRFSVVADSFAKENFEAIRYVKWRGRRWLVTRMEFEEQHRLILTPGGVYNGPTPGSPGPVDIP